MSRSILHCDLDNFYASVECANNPSLKEACVAICGDPQKKHGIVLAKNQKAKLCGVKTGDIIWEAKRKCPELICVLPHFELYLDYSRAVRKIYYEYTDFIESYGLDECWLDITHSKNIGDSVKIAEDLRNQIKKRIGITISSGVSFNKIFAKLGSDMNKPDGITVISESDYKNKIYNLPVSALFMVGKATTRCLNSVNIRTIGQLAAADESLLKKRLGVNGILLKKYAQGKDESSVMQVNCETANKSVGQSCTPESDICTYEKARALILALTEMVSTRLRSYGVCGSTVSVWMRSVFLDSIIRQTTIHAPVCTSQDIYPYALELLKENWRPGIDPPMRSIGVSVSKLSPIKDLQISFFNYQTIRNEKLEYSIDKIRSKYGYNIIKRAASLSEDTRIGLSERDEDALPFKNSGVFLDIK